MRFAAIIKAEEGWRAVFAREDGSASIVPVHFWGISVSSFPFVAIGDDERPRYQEDRRFVVPTQWVPLDDMQDNLSSKDPFVMLLAPNEEQEIPERTRDIANRCVAKAKLLKIAAKSDT